MVLIIANSVLQLQDSPGSKEVVLKKKNGDEMYVTSRRIIALADRQ